MLDIKLIRENTEEAQHRLQRRNTSIESELVKLLELDDERRKWLNETEALKSKKKSLSAAVGVLKKDGKDATSIMEKVKGLNERIGECDEQVRHAEAAVQELLYIIPNLPDDSIPDGADESANEEMRVVGDKPDFGFAVKSHVEIGEKLGILDFKRAAKISGSRFAVYKGQGAKLLRGLIQFMLDLQTEENGYEELYPPFLVNKQSMIGTGQLPKFEEDLYKTDDGLYLIPTAEVPVTNYHRDEILSEEQLPIRYTAYTPCFRREAGSYGKDTTGLIRQHQFDKVEMVQFVTPETSVEALEGLVGHAESVLIKLGLHYRVVTLCAGDLGFSAAKTYDLEVWLPSQNTFREISSCSSFTDYQARRAKIRFKRKAGGKPEFVHTINGSGLAAGRLFVAILENFQQADGTVKIPPVLQLYMGSDSQLG